MAVVGGRPCLVTGRLFHFFFAPRLQGASKHVKVAVAWEVARNVHTTPSNRDVMTANGQVGSARWRS